MPKMKANESILTTIGNTPLVRLNRLECHFHLSDSLYAKVESTNPGGSIKDRIALAMIEEAEKEGKLTASGVIVEPTSGNTGIGLAMVGAVKGYKVIIVMPETASLERRKLLHGLGAEVILTEGSKGISESIRVAEEIKAKTPLAFMPYQFQNLANPKIHYETTAVEIWNQLNGDVSIFIAGIGTGGTISGVGRFLKEKDKNIKIIGLEPKDSPIISKGLKGQHKIQGIGAGLIPDTLDVQIYDEIITITNEEAFEHARLLARIEGILAGISAGAALSGAVKVSSRPSSKPRNIVFVVPDGAERYLSADIY